MKLFKMWSALSGLSLLVAYSAMAFQVPMNMGQQSSFGMAPGMASSTTAICRCIDPQNTEFDPNCARLTGMAASMGNAQGAGVAPQHMQQQGPVRGPSGAGNPAMQNLLQTMGADN